LVAKNCEREEEKERQKSEEKGAEEPGDKVINFFSLALTISGLYYKSFTIVNLRS
jgi:hypothetical protein